MKLGLFFSHAWNDKAGDRVKKLLNHLQISYDVWLDKKRIPIGDVINDEVYKGISDCDIFVNIWSKNAANSEGVRFEIKAAQQLKKPFLILKIDEESIETNEYLKGREFIDFNFDDVRFEEQYVFLDNHLMRLQIAKLVQNNLIEGNSDELIGLDQKRDQVKDVLDELEDYQKRRSLGANGNDSSDTYIQSSLSKGMQLAANDPILSQFMQGLSDISKAHPKKSEDALKQKLTIDLIDKIDPQGVHPYLAIMKKEMLKRPESLITTNTQKIDEQKVMKVFQMKIRELENQKHAEDKKNKGENLFWNLLTGIKDLGIDLLNSYITDSPKLLLKMHQGASEVNEPRLFNLLSIVIRYIQMEKEQKTSTTRALYDYLPESFLINNTARLLIKAGVFKENTLDYSFASSAGIDKIMLPFFDGAKKEKIENFIRHVEENYNIKDSNLDWLKIAAGLIVVPALLGGLSDGSSDNSDGSSSLLGGGSFEDKMASAGLDANFKINYD